MCVCVFFLGVWLNKAVVIDDNYLELVINVGRVWICRVSCCMFQSSGQQYLGSLIRTDRVRFGRWLIRAR